MRFALFYHSIVSDWNHGNAHFLRGIVRELTRRGHAVTVHEPANGWSRANLLADCGAEAIDRFPSVFPGFETSLYGNDGPDLDAALAQADVAIVHEWTDPDLVERIGRLRAQGGRFRLLFHDTHHRSVSAADAMAAYDLSGFDGVLAFGAAVQAIYRQRGWGRRAWVWHEAADTHLFRPQDAVRRKGDLVWIGNWGDGERTAELQEFLLDPIRALRLDATLYGVRYPNAARSATAAAGARYAGWLPNDRVPEVFSAFGVTVHVPRRPYVEALPGIPTIRVFEALACGIPLICSPWQDREGLFRPGTDYLVATDGAMMTRHLRTVLNDVEAAHALRCNGLETIARRHTCAHRVDELLGICAALGAAERHAEEVA